VVYEYDFTREQLLASDSAAPSPPSPPSAYGAQASNRTASIFMPWSAFNATYRGRVQENAPPLNTKNIKRLSILIRR
jgi:hypothetical protein